MVRVVVGSFGRLRLFSFAISAFAWSTLMMAAEPQNTVAQLTQLVVANNRFACKLYGKLKNEDGNLFFSPNSIFTALDMTTAGAAGETATQMRSALQLDSTGNALADEKLHQAAAALVEHLNDGGKSGAYQLTVANRIWGQQGYSFLSTFTKILHDDYGADLAALDFARPDAARQTINAWVEKTTNDKIKDLIPQGALTPLTRLVLTNAVYFKGTWEIVFRKESTRPMPFHLTEANSVDVPTMYQKERHEFGQLKFDGEKSLKILKLDYKKAARVAKGLSMILLLPDDVTGLSALETKLTNENIAKWTSGLNTVDVMVWLPKFKLTSQFGLKDVLSSMGMPLAFDPDAADFSGIDGKRDLYISAVLHKAYVDVYEEGTEAAAATGVVVGTRAMPVSPPEFRADHPFLFLICDEATGCILFMGRVTDPRS